MARYQVDETLIKRLEAEIAAGKTLDLNVRDPETVSWKKVRAVLSHSPLEGGDEAEVFTGAGLVTRPGNLYIKVLEELSDEEMVPGFYQVM
jgi:hypothetical protein